MLLHVNNSCTSRNPWDWSLVQNYSDVWRIAALDSNLKNVGVSHSGTMVSNFQIPGPTVCNPKPRTRHSDFLNQSMASAQCLKTPAQCTTRTGVCLNSHPSLESGLGYQLLPCQSMEQSLGSRCLQVFSERSTRGLSLFFKKKHTAAATHLLTPRLRTLSQEVKDLVSGPSPAWRELIPHFSPG